MFESLLTDRQVIKRYVEAGSQFGVAVSYIYMGECVGFARMLSKWEKWEVEYAKRGYRTLPIDDFINSGGYGKPLKNIEVKRDQDEKPVFHANIYKNVYLGKVEPMIDIQKMIQTGKPQFGNYSLPSTKKSE